MSDTLATQSTDTGTPEADAIAPVDGADASSGNFDDVMLAMDVVDTLRHRERVLDKELSAEAREQALVERLKEIYKNQGIDVPDRILRDGVKALEEKRFVYEPPENTFSVRLARLYIARDRWLKPFAVVFGLAAFGAASYQFAYEAPRQARIEAERVEIGETLPQSLSAARDAALNAAETLAARAAIETVYQDGAAALETANAGGARSAIDELAAMEDVLAKELTVRVISRPGEMSGVFRVHDDDPSIRNYYLIVEAVDARGRVQALRIASEEDQSAKRVSAWGVRVPEGVFNRVAADKRDDQIIQNAVVGSKPRGALTPDYAIEIAGGAILEW